MTSISIRASVINHTLSISSIIIHSISNLTLNKIAESKSPCIRPTRGDSMTLKIVENIKKMIYKTIRLD